MPPALLRVIAIVSIGILPMEAAAPHGAQRCALGRAVTRPITLADSSTVTIDATSIGVYRDLVAIAGTSVNVWPRGASRSSAPRSGPPAIGLLVDSTGRARLIRSPLGDRDVQAPSVASAGAAGWHFIFVTGTLGTTTNALAFDSADVWYGRFDGTEWFDVERIATARKASLLMAATSGVVEAGGGLLFAYPFEAKSPGVVMLRRTSSGWRSDTVRAWEAPRSVRVISRPDGGALALAAQPWFSGRPRGPSLFSTRYDAAWTASRLAFDAAPRETARPLLALLGEDRVVVTWRAALPGNTTEDLDWGYLRADGTLRRVGRVAGLQSMDQPAVLRLDATRALIAVRKARSRRDAQLFVTSDSALTDLGVLSIPFDNFVLLGAPLSNGRLVLVSGALGKAASDPPAANYVTRVVVQCP